MRIVAIQATAPVVVAPDLRRTLPGRGAHLHPDPRCLELARRRKAFGRALRTEGPLDLDQVIDHVIQNQ
ncbi:YlxR family protein [Aeromicrobium sp. CTD01-1L150]|uniref:YlxR family protein n=1 Tax=Aeromicrobium sp. CTD01-1L150 TaxID=3341830 RepID=UPI0035BFFC9B